tara:strand:- start:1047 stop:1823 length:777 start_codon:yes stop_codon:yes gene_type:complete
MTNVIAILSPAKTLDMNKCSRNIEATTCRFKAKSNSLAKIMQTYSSKKMSSLMKISKKLSDLNTERWKSFGKSNNASGPAAICFRGHVYQGFEAWSMDKRSLNWSQKHIRILSGLYGLLRPLDRIEPYRLEMGTALKTDAGSNLYEFWGDSITKLLKKDIKETKASILLNLASLEYVKALDTQSLDVNVVDVNFLEKSKGKTRFISFHAKKARGLMARWISMEKPKSIEALQKFNIGGYTFDSSRSEDSQLTFTRPKP